MYREAKWNDGQRAIEDPDSVEDRVEEGDFADVIEGVDPYPCEVAP